MVGPPRCPRLVTRAQHTAPLVDASPPPTAWPRAGRPPPWLRRPPRALRAAGAAGALLLAGAVLGLGAQPFAVGLLADGWDKVAHAAMHFALAWLLLLAFGLPRGAAVLAACLAFAVLDECAQQFNPGRSVSVGDVAASAAGALLALASAHAFAWGAQWRALRRRRRIGRLIARWQAATRR